MQYHRHTSFLCFVPALDLGTPLKHLDQVLQPPDSKNMECSQPHRIMQSIKWIYFIHEITQFTSSKPQWCFWKPPSVDGMLWNPLFPTKGKYSILKAQNLAHTRVTTYWDFTWHILTRRDISTWAMHCMSQIYKSPWECSTYLVINNSKNVPTSELFLCCKRTASNCYL